MVSVSIVIITASYNLKLSLCTIESRLQQRRQCVMLIISVNNHSVIMAKKVFCVLLLCLIVISEFNLGHCGGKNRQREQKREKPGKGDEVKLQEKEKREKPSKGDEVQLQEKEKREKLSKVDDVVRFQEKETTQAQDQQSDKLQQEGKSRDAKIIDTEARLKAAELKEKERELKEKEKERAKYGENGDLGRLYYTLFKYYRVDIMPSPAAENCQESVPNVDDSCSQAATDPGSEEADINGQGKTKMPLSVKFWITTLGVEFDSSAEVLSTNYYINMIYTDHRLGWNSLNYTNIQSVGVQSSKLWMPDIKLYNRIFSKDSQKYHGEYTAKLSHTGEVSIIVPAYSQTYCYFDAGINLEVCPMKFKSWSTDISSMNLELDVNLQPDHCLPTRGCYESNLACSTSVRLYPASWNIEKCEAVVEPSVDAQDPPMVTYTYYFKKQQEKDTTDLPTGNQQTESKKAIKT